jgi:FMN phosphatase YigB (HAD superfamily)
MLSKGTILDFYLKLLQKYSSLKASRASYEIASFDVYDTCITRLTGSPRSLFFILAYNLDLRPFGIDERRFVYLRSQAEAFAYARNGETTTLEDIYREFGTLIPSRDFLDRAREKETELEKRCAVAIPDTVERINEERRKGKKIAFLSDMYLPSRTIRDILQSKDICRDGDVLLVSNEEKTEKTSAGLFNRLKNYQDYGGRILHRGDNPHSDLRGALKANCSAVLDTPAALNKYERIMEKFSDATGGFSSYLAGISRAIRLAGNRGGERDKTITNVTAGMAVPILAAFVLWILRESSRMKIERLYFVSRDGEVLLEIAKKLSALSGEFGEIELRYLYGSRHAWYPPSIRTKEDLEEAFDTWLFESKPDDTPEDFFARLNVSVDDIREFLPESCWRGKTKTDKAKIKQFLFSDDILPVVLEKSAQFRGKVLSYLRQEGLSDPNRWGYVDLSWKGRMQQKLADFVAEIGGQPPTGLYFALARRPASGKYGEYLEFQKFAERPDTFPIIMEILCNGSHGVVTGYREDTSGKTAPLLKSKENESFRRWGMIHYRNVIEEFCDCLVTRLIDIRGWDFNRDMLFALLDAFWLYPNRDEATVWGQFEFSTDATEHAFFTAADKVRPRNFIGEFLPRWHPYRLNFFWPEGTVMSSPRVLGRIFLIFHKCVVLAKRFILRLCARR